MLRVLVLNCLVLVIKFQVKNELNCLKYQYLLQNLSKEIKKNKTKQKQTNKKEKADEKRIFG